MKLYYHPGACSLSPHIALVESSLPFFLEFTDTKTHKLRDGTDFYAINPLGYVPILELADGTRLREGAAIAQYIADRVPEKNLAPPNGSMERYHLQEWLDFISTELQKTIFTLFHYVRDEESQATVRAKLTGRLSWIDQQLVGRSYLMGEDFSVADALLFAILRWLPLVKLNLVAFDRLAQWQERVLHRPAVQKALATEGPPSWAALIK